MQEEHEKSKKNPHKSLYEAFCEGAETGGKNSPALLYMNKKFSYGFLKKKIDALASALVRVGVSCGEVVTVALPNVPQAVYCIYGISAVGGIAYLVHALSSRGQMEKMLEKTGSKILFALDSFAHEYEELCREKGVRLISCNPTDGLGVLKRAVYSIRKPKLSYSEDFSLFLRTNSVSKLGTMPETVPTATSILLNSGGTSGEPKTVELSAYSINALDMNGFEILGKQSVKGEYMMSALPYFHVFGLSMGLHAMMWHGGCNVLIPKFRRSVAVSYVRRGKITYMIGVPALYKAMLSHKRFKGAPLRKINVGFIGGDFIPQTLLNDFNERMKKYGSGARLFEGYGLTEGGAVVCVNTHSSNKSGTVGRAVRGVTVKVFEADESGTGELCIKGGTLMNGYFKDPVATANAIFTDEHGDRWLRTGDCGFVDPDGFVHFKQRLKRIIKVSGVSVFPAEIEQSVSFVRGVGQVCAHAVPDVKKGHAIRLVIETSRTDTETMRSELEEEIKKQLSRDCYPREIVFTKNMPLTKMNKIDYSALENMSAEQLAQK